MKRYIQALKSRLKKVKIVFFKPYYIFRNSWPVWFLILNREGRKLQHQHKPLLNDVQRRIAEEFKKNGIAVAHVEDLFPGENILRDLQERAKYLLPKAETKTAKKFLLNLFDRQPVFDFKDPFMAFAINPRLLEIANDYMGMFSKFRYFSLNLTTPILEDTEPVQSQRWHRDPEDKRICKIFIYLTDVGDEAGPFMYATGSHYGGKRGNLFPAKLPKGCYPPIGAVEKTVPKDEIRVCTGKAGTIVFADTRGLHKGGYAKSKKRLMFTAGYASKAATWVVEYLRPDNFNKELEKLNKIQQYVLRK